jgi:ribosome biogenesis GTPase A
MGNNQSMPGFTNGLGIFPVSKEFMAAVPQYNSQGVVLYDSPGMVGNAKYFPPGSYPDLSVYDFARRARSMTVGPNTKVVIFTGSNQTDMNTSYANGDTTTFGIADLTIFNNAISSMTVTTL